MSEKVYPWRVELPSGAHATFRDPKQVPRGRRRAHRLAILSMDPDLVEALDAAARARAARDVGEQPEQADADAEAFRLTEEWQEQLWAVQDAATLMLLLDWSFDLPLSIDSLDMISDDDAERLAEASASIVNETEFSPTPTPAQLADDDSPTDPSPEQGSTGEGGAPNCDPLT